MATARVLTGDGVVLSAVKCNFVTAIEGCVRAASHVISSEGLGMPSSSAAAVLALGNAGIIPSAVAEPVARAVGFRNVLVHEYAEADDDAVRANVAGLDELEAYVVAMAAWASRRSRRALGPRLPPGSPPARRRCAATSGVEAAAG